MPNVVKGSKQEKMVVVPYRPGRRFVLVCFLALGIGASAIGGFMFGYSNTLRSQQFELATRQELSDQLIDGSWKFMICKFVHYVVLEK